MLAVFPMPASEYYDIEMPDSVAVAATEGAAEAEGSESKSAARSEDEVQEHTEEDDAEASETVEEPATATVPLSLVGEPPEVGATVRFRVKAVTEDGIELEPLADRKKDYEKEIDELNED